MLDSIYEKIYSKLGVNLDARTKYKIFNWNYKFFLLMWFIARTIAILYIFNQVLLEKIGFQKTLITLIVIFNMLLWANLKLKTNPFQYNKV